MGTEAETDAETDTDTDTDTDTGAGGGTDTAMDTAMVMGAVAGSCPDVGTGTATAKETEEFMTRRMVSINDMLRGGACFDGVMEFVSQNGYPIAMYVDEVEELCSWYDIRTRVGLDGYGDGDGYGAGDGDGYGCGYSGYGYGHGRGGVRDAFGGRVDDFGQEFFQGDGTGDGLEGDGNGGFLW